ncbi:hypothetical protein E2493_20565 [Sphingomonas parva]|uniref:Uncharacterized protein n=1 Tax=Sphingomonas parva TaxID=2555898 RepID=A0A4Y8ZM83_9SPHN|nr:hypothetical protein [Sphingomonas parva]TFI56362.1 hypothetical protein E2493_20565 [Sphingomonas parva]
MEDVISFVFSGKLAHNNEMDFYEAARFQYAASRLTVKLDKFRRTGEFPKKVTRQNNTAINLRPYRPGSFGIDIIGPALATLPPLLYELPITSLWTYVIERVFKPAESDTIKQALQTQADLIRVFDASIASSDRQATMTLQMLERQIAQEREVNEEVRELYERLLAETQRRSYLEAHQEVLNKITPEQDAELVTMATPLLKEIAVPLRRSASLASVNISDKYGRRRVLSATRRMADEVETIRIDPQITPVRLDIVQYNKESGWGKFRNPEFDGQTPFSVPADRKENLKSKLTRAMNKDEVFVLAYYVRSVTGKKLRIIITDFVEDEA